MSRRFALIVAIAAAFTLVAAAFASTETSRSIGFSAEGGKVRCAVRVPGSAGLLCAAGAVRTWQYDGRGIVRLSSSGRTSILRSGSDLLLAIDGNLDHTSRPTLAAGRTWRVAAYSCVLHVDTITCRDSGHGFSLTPTHLVRF